jgi:hypothetical protein
MPHPALRWFERNAAVLVDMTKTAAIADAAISCFLVFMRVPFAHFEALVVAD